MANRAQLLSVPTCQAERCCQIPQEWKSFTTGGFAPECTNKSGWSEISGNPIEDIFFHDIIFLDLRLRPVDSCLFCFSFTDVLNCITIRG